MHVHMHNYVCYVCYFMLTKMLILRFWLIVYICNVNTIISQPVHLALLVLVKCVIHEYICFTSKL